MGSYDNGNDTRKQILNTCFYQFLTNGFHETSVEDICKAAHVNRSSVYYHFHDKDNIRYEVLWELIIRCRNQALRYCPNTKNGMALAIRILYVHLRQEPALWKFLLDYWKDFPVYNPRSSLGAFYSLLYRGLFESIWDRSRISSLAFASMYGHICGIHSLASARPDRYRPEEIHKHCFDTVTQIWHIPEDKADALWDSMEADLKNIPLDRLPEILEEGVLD